MAVVTAARPQVTLPAASTPATVSDANRWVRAVRPQHWTKAALVLAAPLVAVDLTATTIVRVLCAAVLACCAASGAYLINDAVDAAMDRLHPKKRFRPVAAGEITRARAVIVGAVLLVVAPALGTLLSASTAAVLVAYALITVVYSTWLKRLPVIDIVTIAAGFIMRVLVGSTATGTPVAAWFLVAVAAGSVMVATGKRRGEHRELGIAGPRHRRSLSVYRDNVTGPLLGVSATALCAALAGWATIGSGGPHLVPIWACAVLVSVLVGIGRYLRIAFRGRAARPEALVRDHMMQLAAVSTAVIYLAGRVLS